MKDLIIYVEDTGIKPKNRAELVKGYKQGVTLAFCKYPPDCLVKVDV